MKKIFILFLGMCLSLLCITANAQNQKPRVLSGDFTISRPCELYYKEKELTRQSAIVLKDGVNWVIEQKDFHSAGKIVKFYLEDSEGNKYEDKRWSSNEGLKVVRFTEEDEDGNEFFDYGICDDNFSYVILAYTSMGYLARIYTEEY